MNQHTITEKMLSLCQESTQWVDSCLPTYYWQCDDYKFNNIHLMRWYQTKFNKWATTVDRHLPDIRHALEDKTFNMQKNYDLEYLQHLRNQHKHITLLFSGGYDSVEILRQAAENDVYIDKVLTVFFGEKSDNSNQELHENAIPLIKKYQKNIGTWESVVVSHNDIEQSLSDPYSFFTMPTAGPMPQIIAQYDNYNDRANDAHVIRGGEKPSLIYFNRRWYTALLDVKFGGDLPLPGMVNFWINDKNIKSLIKYSRLMREHIIASNGEFLVGNKIFVSDNSEFFNTKVLRRPILPKPDKQMSKIPSGTVWDEKTNKRLSSLIDRQQWSALTNFFNCAKTQKDVYMELPDNSCHSDGKFAWLIDIDNLEVYTQEELIPSGAFS